MTLSGNLESPAAARSLASSAAASSAATLAAIAAASAAAMAASLASSLAFFSDAAVRMASAPRHGSSQGALPDGLARPYQLDEERRTDVPPRVCRAHQAGPSRDQVVLEA